MGKGWVSAAVRRWESAGGSWELGWRARRHAEGIARVRRSPINASSPEAAQAPRAGGRARAPHVLGDRGGRLVLDVLRHRLGLRLGRGLLLGGRLLSLLLRLSLRRLSLSKLLFSLARLLRLHSVLLSLRLRRGQRGHHLLVRGLVRHAVLCVCDTAH